MKDDLASARDVIVQQQKQITVLQAQVASLQTEVNGLHAAKLAATQNNPSVMQQAQASTSTNVAVREGPVPSATTVCDGNPADRKKPRKFVPPRTVKRPASDLTLLSDHT